MQISPFSIVLNENAFDVCIRKYSNGNLALSKIFLEQFSTGHLSLHLAVQVKTTTGRRCKTNVAYETRELPPDPESEQTDMDTAKTASLQNTNYYRHAISSPTRWRAFMIIIFFMIVLSLAMISVQAFWLFGGCCKSTCCALLLDVVLIDRLIDRLID